MCVHLRDLAFCSRVGMPVCSVPMATEVCVATYCKQVFWRFWGSISQSPWRSHTTQPLCAKILYTEGTRSTNSGAGKSARPPPRHPKRAQVALHTPLFSRRCTAYLMLYGRWAFDRGLQTEHVDGHQAADDIKFLFGRFTYVCCVSCVRCNAYHTLSSPPTPAGCACLLYGDLPSYPPHSCCRVC